MNESLIDQLREWATQLEDNSSDFLRNLPGVIAGMREVANDLERDISQRPACNMCGSQEGAIVPSGSADAHCAHCGADWISADECKECGVTAGDGVEHAEECPYHPDCPHCGADGSVEVIGDRANGDFVRHCSECDVEWEHHAHMLNVRAGKEAENFRKNYTPEHHPGLPAVLRPPTAEE